MTEGDSIHSWPGFDPDSPGARMAHGLPIGGRRRLGQVRRPLELYLVLSIDGLRLLVWGLVYVQ